MNKLEVTNFINKNKHLIGYGNYEVLVSFNITINKGLASIKVSESGQDIIIEFSKKFGNMCNSKQINIILHELIHGRVELMQNRLEDAEIEQEEYMVNDIARLCEAWKV